MVALGIRIRLTHELIASLEIFHRVGWVHKGISSHNTFFFHAIHPLVVVHSVFVSTIILFATVKSSPWI